MPLLAAPAQQRAALKLRSLLAKHQEIELLLKLGEYREGSDALADEAIAKHAKIKDFLAQSRDEATAYAETVVQLETLVAA